MAKYGAATALWDVSLDVAAGELVCVVGPNGAGKTTLINVIAGLNRIAAGSLVLDGRDLSKMPAHRFCAAGIAIVPEGRRLFTAMTVRENLAIGSYRGAAKAHRRESVVRLIGEADEATHPARGQIHHAGIAEDVVHRFCERYIFDWLPDHEG